MKTLRWMLLSFMLYGPLGCGLAQEEERAPVQEAKKTTTQEAKKAPVQEAKKATIQEEKKTTKGRDVEAVISAVGQRTITFQVERKGRVREEVVGIDEKTDIEKDGAKVKLKDLQETDKALIQYEPDAYTPAVSVKVIGKGEIQKVGGED